MRLGLNGGRLILEGGRLRPPCCCGPTQFHEARECPTVERPTYGPSVYFSTLFRCEEGPTLRSGPITAVSTGNPCVITAPQHGLTTGVTVDIINLNTTPQIGGFQTITVLDADRFSIGVNVTAVADGVGGWSSMEANDCRINGGRIIVVGSVCHEVVGIPGQTEECGGITQNKALILDELPEGEVETPIEAITCKERGLTCETGDCIPVGPRACCLGIPVAELPCRCVAGACNARSFGACEYGQLIRVTWVWQETLTTWLSSSNANQTDCQQTLYTTYVAQGTMSGVYECDGDLYGNNSPIARLVSSFGSITRVFTVNPVFADPSLPPYSHTEPWVPTPTVNLAGSVTGDHRFPDQPFQRQHTNYGGLGCNTQGEPTSIGCVTLQPQCYCTLSMTHRLGNRFEDAIDNCRGGHAIANCNGLYDDDGGACGGFDGRRHSSSMVCSITTLERCIPVPGGRAAELGRPFAADDILE